MSRDVDILKHTGRFCRMSLCVWCFLLFWVRLCSYGGNITWSMTVPSLPCLPAHEVCLSHLGSADLWCRRCPPGRHRKAGHSSLCHHQLVDHVRSIQGLLSCFVLKPHPSLSGCRPRLPPSFVCDQSLTWLLDEGTSVVGLQALETIGTRDRRGWCRKWNLEWFGRVPTIKKKALSEYPCTE